MGFNDNQYNQIMNAKPKYWYEYPTYKKRFEKLRPLFYLLAKSNLVPMSFYPEQYKSVLEAYLRSQD